MESHVTSMCSHSPCWETLLGPLFGHRGAVDLWILCGHCSSHVSTQQLPTGAPRECTRKAICEGGVKSVKQEHVCLIWRARLMTSHPITSPGGSLQRWGPVWPWLSTEPFGLQQPLIVTQSEHKMLGFLHWHNTSRTENRKPGVGVTRGHQGSPGVRWSRWSFRRGSDGLECLVVEEMNCGDLLSYFSYDFIRFCRLLVCFSCSCVLIGYIFH